MLEIYTDGSSKAGVGSWAFIICRNGKPIQEQCGRMRSVTNNAMEIQAAIEALDVVPADSTVTLYSDSRILIDAMTLNDVPRAYQNRIDQLKLLSQKLRIRWQWVKAHHGNEFNERCDLLCIRARKISNESSHLPVFAI